MKKLVVLLPLVLAGCASSIKPSFLAPEFKVVEPPEELYYCPEVTRYPESETLTDRQVGILVLKYHRNLTICKKNMEALKQFNVDAKNNIEANNK